MLLAMPVLTDVWPLVLNRARNQKQKQKQPSDMCSFLGLVSLCAVAPACSDLRIVTNGITLCPGCLCQPYPSCTLSLMQYTSLLIHLLLILACHLSCHPQKICNNNARVACHNGCASIRAIPVAPKEGKCESAAKNTTQDQITGVWLCLIAGLGTQCPSSNVKYTKMHENL